MFDPYHKWLGIPKDQRPPTFYQLLGITPGEEDVEVIEEAAIRQTTLPAQEPCTSTNVAIALSRKLEPGSIAPSHERDRNRSSEIDVVGWPYPAVRGPRR